MSDSETEITKVPADAAKTVVKEKKKRPPKTEKQMEAMKKAMAALKVKREAAAQDIARLQEIKKLDMEKAKEQLDLAKKEDKALKKRARQAQLPPEAGYMLRGDFIKEMNSFKEAIIQALPKEVYREVVKEVEKPVEKITVVPKTVVREKSVPVPTPISGSALLDKIYFNR
jgi:hypothetical protein